MKSAFNWVPGTLGGPGYVSCVFGVQWIFAILAPSGKGLPLPGTPARRASIMTGFPKIAANLPPLSLVEMTGQSSYPLNSENAGPLGICTVYLSCAEMALPPNTASTVAIVTISQDEILVIVILPLRFLSREATCR